MYGNTYGSGLRTSKPKTSAIGSAAPNALSGIKPATRAGVTFKVKSGNDSVAEALAAEKRNARR